jgi:hypothetical protein
VKKERLQAIRKRVNRIDTAYLPFIVAMALEDIPVLLDEVERLEEENQRLREQLKKAEEFIDAVTSLCGQNLQVYGWHLNGAPEPFDNLIEDDGTLLDEIRQALKGGDSK